MKKRNLIIIPSLIAISPIVNLCACTTSVNEPEVHNLDESTIVLTAGVQYLIPGKSINISAHYEHEIRKINPSDLNWSVESPYKQIFVNSSGVVTAAPSTPVSQEHIYSAIVHAELKTSPSIKGEISLPIISDQQTTNFYGFVENKLQAPNRDGEICDYHITKTSELEYRVDEPISVYGVGTGQEEYISLNFTPIFNRSSDRFMIFHDCSNDALGSDDGVLSWADGYEDGEETNTIPGFTVEKSTGPFSTQIDVTFCCDEEPNRTHLIIDLWIWLNPTQIAYPYIAYYPQSDNDPYRVQTSVIDAVFESNLFCPAKKNGQIYSGCMSPIYCFKATRESSEYTFDINLSGQDKRLKNAFKMKLTTRKTYRQLDHLAVYILSISYSFDLSIEEMPEAKDVDFAALTLGTIEIKDHKQDAEYLEGTYKLTIGWLK